MGFTLPRKYGGLNCPSLVYTMATEMVSRADTSLMNLFGLQGIAETIYAFASDEIKDETAAAVLPRRSDRRHGADRARRRQRPAGRPPAGLPGRRRQLVFERRETIHHQRLRRDPAGAGPQRAGDFRRPRAEPVRHRALAAGPRAAPGKQAGHPRLAHLRAGVRRHAGPAHRRAAAGIDHLRDGADERGTGGHRGAVAGRGRGRLSPGPHLRPHPAAVRRAHRAIPGRGRAGDRHEDRHRGSPRAGLRDRPRLRPREQQHPRAGVDARPGQGRAEAAQAVGPHR